MAFYKTQGIVLGSRAFGENGKLVTFFTPDHGKIKVVAKGALRPTSKFGGRLLTLSLLELLLASGRNLDILSQCETIESFQGLREREAALKSALYFVRIIDASTLDRQKNFDLFKLLMLSLKKLQEGEDPSKVEKYFEVNFLKVEGLYRRQAPPEVLIGEHLGLDIRKWKK